MAKKKQRKMSFRGKVKADNKNHEKGNSKFSVLNIPEGVELYKPTAGNRDMFDVIPYVVNSDKHPDKDSVDFDGVVDTIAHKGDIWYKRPYKVHKNVGADNQTVICLESFGKPCPICEYKKAQQAKGLEWDDIKYLKPKDRVLYAIKPVDIKKAKDCFHILDMSFYLFQTKLNEETNEDEEYEDFPMLEGGLSLKVRWVEGSLSKKGHEYCEASRIDFVERDEDYNEDILDEVPCLDDILIEMSYDKMKALFFEDDVEDAEDDEEQEETPFKEDEDEKPAKKKATKKAKAKKEVDPEPEPEEEEWDWDALEAMDLEDLADACDSYDLDAEEIVDEEEDEVISANLLRKALAEELDIEVPKPAKNKATKKATSKKRSTKKDTHKCPIEGGEFGVTIDEYEECDNCSLLEACIKKNEED